MKKSIRLYMDKIDFEHELGYATVKLYPSLKSIKSNAPCVSECGIVEVEVKLKKVVRQTKFKK